MPVHPSEENAPAGLTEKVAKDASSNTESTASDHHSHANEHTPGGEKPKAQAHDFVSKGPQIPLTNDGECPLVLSSACVVCEIRRRVLEAGGARYMKRGMRLRWRKKNKNKKCGGAVVRRREVVDDGEAAYACDLKGLRLMNCGVDLPPKASREEQESRLKELNQPKGSDEL